MFGLFLGDAELDHLLGYTMFAAAASFLVGVMCAYFFWGMRYFQAVEAEAAKTVVNLKYEELRREQQELQSQV